MDLFDLAAKLSLDSGNYEKGVDKAEKKTKKLSDSIGKGLKTAAKVGAAAIAAVTTATVALTTSIINGTKEVAAYGDNIDKASQKMGISAQAYQEWDAILQHSGSSIDSLQRGMTTLAKAAESNSDAFARLGISQEEIADLNQEQLFARTIEGLQKMESGTERTVLAQELLGGSARELGALLNTSAEETEEMRKRLHKLGGIMSDEAVKAAAAYQDSLQDMQTALSGAKRGLISEFLPAVTTVMDGLTELFSGNSSGIGKVNDGIRQFVANISKTLPKVLPMVGGIISSIGGAILDNADVIIDSAIDLIIRLVNAVVDALPRFVRASIQIIRKVASSLTQNVRPLLNAVVSATSEILKVLTDPALINDLIDSGLEMMVALADGITTSLPSIIPTVISAIETLLTTLATRLQDFLPTMLQSAVTLLSALVDAIPVVIVQLVQYLPSVITTITDALSGSIPLVVDAAVTLLFGIIDAIPTIIEALTDSLPDIITSIVGLLIDNVPVILDGAVQMFLALVEAIPEILPQLGHALESVVKTVFDNLAEPLKKMFGDVWGSITKLAKGAWDGIKGIWNVVSNWFQSTVVAPVKNAFSGAWNALKNGAKGAWDGIKSVFMAIPNWFKDKFQSAWQRVKDVFSSGGQIFSGIKDGIVNAFKAVVNALIGGINKVVAIPFNAINSMLQKLRDINILGVSPFGWIRTFSVPQIPFLAKGGIVSDPTLAMIGENGREAIVPLENNTEWMRKVASEMASELNRSNDSILTDIQETLHAILANMGVDIVLSDGVIAGRVDRILGQTAMRKMRGNA